MTTETAKKPYDEDVTIGGRDICGCSEMCYTCMYEHGYNRNLANSVSQEDEEAHFESELARTGTPF